MSECGGWRNCMHGGANGFSSQSCSWLEFVAGLPADDPVRVAEEAGEGPPMHDPRWSGDPCDCDCHDGEDE